MPKLAVLASPDARLIRICDRMNEGLLYLTYFLIPVFFIILTRDQFELPKLTVLRILTSAMLGTWLIRVIAARQWEFKKTPLDLPLLVWSGLQILTTVLSVSGYISWQGEYENFRGLITVLNYVVLYYLAIHFLRTRAQIDRLLLVIFMSSLVVTSYGIGQFFGIDFIAWNPDSIAPGRYFSSLGNPNFLAAYIAMVMPLLVIFFLESTSLFRRVLLFISFIIMFLALMGTWSRGGFLGLLAALLVLLIFGLERLFHQLKQGQPLSFFQLLIRQGRLHKQWVALISLILAILVIISATFGKHIMLRFADTVLHFKAAIKVSRLHIWKPALQMIHDYPLLGTGLDTFKTVFPRYATPDFAAIDGANVSSRTAHNEVLQVLSTQGVIGLGIVIWLTVAILLAWKKAYQRSGNSGRDRLILIGLLGSWTAYSVQNLFSFGVVAIDTFYWLILAILGLFQQTPEEHRQHALAQVPAAQSQGVFGFITRYRSGLILVILGTTGYLIWQSYQVALADYAFNLGTMFRMRNMWTECIAAFTKAAELVPGEVKYVVYEGLAYEEKAKAAPDDQKWELVQKAIKLYQRGVDMNSTNAYYLGNLGRAYSYAASLKNDKEYYKKAIAAFQSAIHYAPVTVLFYQNLALTYFTYKDEENFWKTIDQLAAFDKMEAAKLAFNAANQLFALNLVNQAIGYYQKAIALDPNYVEAYFNLGVTLVRTQGPQQAIPLWQKALQIKPNFEPAQQMLIRYQAK